MHPAGSRFADVALPVPLDKPFTYELPETLRHRVQPGCRLLVPFAHRKLTGVALACHDQSPPHKALQALRLLDEEPALTDELLGLGRWIADYYCAPIGEVLKTMVPLGGETRTEKVVSLTPAGMEAARHFTRSGSPNDPYVQLLRTLEKQPRRADYLKRKLPDSDTALRGLKRKGWLEIETVVKERDPLLARGGRLIVAAEDLDAAPPKPTKGERWLIDYLANHSGAHDVEALALERKDVATVARRLTKTGVVHLSKIATGDETPDSTPAKQQPRLKLNPDQRRAFEAARQSIRANGFQTFLLHGITGSGKTEVYLRAIEESLASGKSALLLVPEIGLTPAVAAQFFARFGDDMAILHSAFSGLERSGQWRRVREGKARVVLGTRSGVFAPVANLGLVVIDEEHDASYKQDDTPRYNGRDVAVVRAQMAGATVLLGSATPSLETRYNVERGKYQLLSLPDRIEKRPLPRARTIDMRQEFVETGQQSLFARRLDEQIRRRLAQREQIILLLNRRGFSSFVACRSCGERIECQNCSVTLTHHRRDRRLVCHYCEYSEPIPKRCPECKSEYLYFLGSGSEKVEDLLREHFPRARIARLDRDTVRGRGTYESILHDFREGHCDMLVGTQMVAKGHDVPNVTLVGVVSADIGLGMPDFRAAERTFQLLTQVAGRAGRGSTPGEVLIQTINPEHYAIKFAAAQDYEGFYSQELHFRRLLRYPPFVALAMMIIRSKKLEEALALSGRLGQHLKDLPRGVRMLGPASAPVAKLKSDFRYQFLIKAEGRKALSQVLKKARAFAVEHNWPATALVIDVDPLSLM